MEDALRRYLGLEVVDQVWARPAAQLLEPDEALTLAYAELRAFRAGRDAPAAYVVTKRGRPAAVIMPIEEAEDLVLANAEEFVKMRRSARAAYRHGRSHPLRELD